MCEDGEKFEVSEGSEVNTFILARRFVKKPVQISAIQFETNNDDGSCLEKLVNWIKGFGGSAYHDGTNLFIETLKGKMRADCGDWIIKGVEGEFYPCKPDIFNKSYDPVPYF